jgi:hypothetical protein
VSWTGIVLPEGAVFGVPDGAGAFVGVPDGAGAFVCVPVGPGVLEVALVDRLSDDPADRPPADVVPPSPDAPAWGRLDHDKDQEKRPAKPTVRAAATQRRRRARHARRRTRESGSRPTGPIPGEL